MLITKLLKGVTNPRLAIIRLLSLSSRMFPDELYIRLRYRLFMRKRLNLKNPQTFNEKLQWLKLHDRNPIYTNMVDKYEAKNIAAKTIGAEHIIPTLGVWDRFEDINFSLLPDQFVLKCTHDSGGNIICKDKSSLNIDEAREMINRCLRHNYFYEGREWPYKNVKPRIIAEKYMVDDSGYELKDYKFFCFNGDVKAMFIATDRASDTRFDFYDVNFNHLPIINGHPNAKKMVLKPQSFDEMLRMARLMSMAIPHVRIDFYEINGVVYFGEYTFSHWGGTIPLEPMEWDYTFGSWLKLPTK